MLAKPDILISSNDYQKLYELLDKMQKNDSVERLIDELERAEIIENELMPESVVEMHSKVTFTVLSSGKTFTYTLVYPSEVSTEDHLSILAPIGSAILGLSNGDEIEWPLNNGRTTQVRIESIEKPKK